MCYDFWSDQSPLAAHLSFSRKKKSCNRFLFPRLFATRYRMYDSQKFNKIRRFLGSVLSNLEQKAIDD